MRELPLNKTPSIELSVGWPASTVTDSRPDKPLNGLEFKLVNEMGSDIEARAVFESIALFAIEVVPAGI
jgi:hypothetical protein